jgi:DnaK suppressor protein
MVKGRPSEKEEYMNEKHLEYFQNKLLRWKEDLIRGSKEAIDQLQESNLNEPDPMDKASAELETSSVLRTRDRFRKLIDKIDYALKRIEDKTYGYCEETGDPIGLLRLEARPVATLSIAAQERREKYERTHKEEK